MPKKSWIKGLGYIIALAGALVIFPQLLLSAEKDLKSSPPVMPMPPDSQFSYTTNDPDEIPAEEILKEEEEDEDDQGEDEDDEEDPVSSCVSLGGDSCVSSDECLSRGGSCVPGVAFTCDLGCCCDEPEAVQCPSGTAPCSEGCPNVACFDTPLDSNGDGCCTCGLQCSTCPTDPSCPAVCGNAITTGNEGCDDGNTVSGDGCSAACQPEFCGDGTTAAGEECDDGNTSNGDGCNNNCQIEECGNNRLDPGEACDDGDTASGDGCSPTCQIEPGCGNGRTEGTEACDDGNTNSGDGCDSDCVAEICGNRVVQSGEVCDDGNTANGDGCSSSCQREIVIDCPSGGSCVSQAQCQSVPGGTELGACGSGNVCCEIPAVVCSPADSDGGWNEQVRGVGTAYLNGIANPFADECTNGGASVIEYYCIGNTYDQQTRDCPSGTACLGNAGECLTLGAVGECGNGIWDQNENCEDGNTTPGDGCDSNCQLENEECTNDDDDGGNDVRVQGTTYTTKYLRQGDGTVVTVEGFRSFTDFCRDSETIVEFIAGGQQCAIVQRCPPDAPQCISSLGICGKSCGNNVTDAGEECDPTDTGAWPAGTCTDDCKKIAYCGDGTQNQPSEQCDSGPNCGSDCQWICGDSAAGEACPSGSCSTGKICSNGCCLPITDSCDRTCRGDSYAYCQTCSIQGSACVCQTCSTGECGDEDEGSIMPGETITIV